MSEAVPEFSRLVEANKMNREILITANEAECVAVAKRLDVESISSFEARMTLKKTHGDNVLVTGELKAKLTQICIVTLEQFESEIVAQVDATYADGPLPEFPDDHVFSEKDLEVTDEIVNGKIDLGELAVQTLSLENRRVSPQALSFQATINNSAAITASARSAQSSQ